MSKKPHNHYCRICEQYKANEKFSGRAVHICKACANRGDKPKDIVESSIVFYDDIDFKACEVDYDGFQIEMPEEPIKPKKKRKPNKAKLLRSAQKKKAKALLSKILADGEVKKNDIIETATKVGIPIEALRRAKGSLKICAIQTEKDSMWRLPNFKKEQEYENEPI